MTPMEVNYYITYLHAITHNIIVISDHVWDCLEDSKIHGWGDYGDETKMMNFFRHYSDKETIFLKLIDFHTGADRTFRFARGPFDET